MDADDRPEPAHARIRRRSRRPITTPARLGIGLVALASIVAFGLLAIAMLQSQAGAREEAIGRFADRAAVTSRVLSGTLAQSAETTARTAGEELSGIVRAADLERFEGDSAAMVPYSAVFDAEGRLLGSSPANLRDDDARRRRVLAAAAANEPSTSPLVDDVLEYHVPFEAADGRRRVLVVGYPKRLLGPVFAGALADAIEAPRSGYVVDENGALVSAIGSAAGDDTTPSAIADAVRQGRTSGSFSTRRFAIDDVDGTSLSVAISSPESAILDTLPSSTWPRLTLLGLALAMLAVAVLMTRMYRAGRRLDEARRDADRANDAKSQLLAHITHELKTPIAVVRGFAELLERSELPEREREYAEHVVEGGEHLASLVNELLDVSRIETGQVALAIERIDVHVVVDEVLALAAPLAADRSIRLEPPRVRDPLPPMLADPLRVRQVLLNLLSNAIKYNHDGGSVRVEVGTTGDDMAWVAITDTGPGIDGADFDRLFEPFDRLGAERGPTAGSGLGLAVSKGLAEAMSGRLDVTSQLGQGSTFTLALPLAPEGITTHPAGPVPEADAGDLVYLDDSRPSLDLAESLLNDRRPGVRLRTATSGADGMQLVLDRVPDLLLLDLNLPDMHGETVLRRLRSRPDTAQLPILVVSADSTSRDVLRLLRTGADAYLTKPLDGDQFLDVIDRLLAPGRS